MKQAEKTNSDTHIMRINKINNNTCTYLDRERLTHKSGKGNKVKGICNSGKRNTQRP